MPKLCNSRHKEYFEILSQINPPSNPVLNTGGKLIVCLIEFRPMVEIKYVIWALFKSYNPSDIGLSIVYGNRNKEFVEKEFKKWKNIKLIHKPIDNMDRGQYSALLKQPQLYENFSAWQHVLIYQTDALLFRKIDPIYFKYSYIGAPWILNNQWCKYNAGNGGFSLRNVKDCIRVTESNRRIPHDKIHRGNEDGFFCSQDSFKYPPFNSELHRAFSVERVNFREPVGCHQIYHNFNMSGQEWKAFMVYMENSLLKGIPSQVDATKLDNKPVSPQSQPTCQPHPTHSTQSALSTPPQIIGNGKRIDEMLNTTQKFGPFELILTHQAKNRWEIECLEDYEILFCRTDDPNTSTKTHKISRNTEACVHKKAPGVSYLIKDGFIYIIFYKGFPNGGEAWADISAGGHFNHCRELPKDGAIILKAPYGKSSEIVPASITGNIKQIKDKILAFDLYTGVGWFNQLFSLELAVYMAIKSNRYLVLNVRHPLVSAGKPDRSYGLLVDYLDPEFRGLLKGFEVRAIETMLHLPMKSNCHQKYLVVL